MSHEYSQDLSQSQLSDLDPCQKEHFDIEEQLLSLTAEHDPSNPIPLTPKYVYMKL